MIEEAVSEHRKFTPRERKERTLQRVDVMAKWIGKLREQAGGGGITWEQFDNLVARAMVARERYADWMKKHSLIDRLTGIPNRRWFDLELEREIEESKRSGGLRAVLILDIDDFKKGINDKYGHIVGDQVLRTVAQTVQKHIRAEDFLGKYGGEEFAVIVIDPQKDILGKITERLREAVEKINIEGIPKITVSIGGTFYKQDEDLESFIKRADQALYKSKDTGKNKVTVE